MAGFNDAQRAQSTTGSFSMTIKTSHSFLLIGFAFLMGLGLMAYAVNLVRAQETAVSPAALTATTITVNTDADELNSNNNCSLREAIVAANTDTAVDNCPAGSGADTITFADNYTITLTSALPDITTDVTIDGEGAANTIVQASTCNPVTLPGGCTPADWRVFTFTAGASTLKDMTVRYGNCDSDATCSGLDDSDGGNIYASNGSTSLTLDAVNVQSGFGNVYGGGISAYGGDLTVQNNSLIGGSGAGNQSGNGEGGGIHFDSDGRLLINNSEISYNQSNSRGGGVNAYYCGDQLNLEASTISNNFTDGSDGGGLWTDCTTTINDSTFANNQALYASGGSLNGGAIYNNGTLTVVNSTFYNNSAQNGGAIYNSSGLLTVANSTFDGNSTTNDGGAIMNWSTLNLTNSTFFDNSASADGGGVWNYDAATVTNNTFSGNSEAIYNLGTLHLKNSILANSTSGDDCTNAYILATDTNNLIENNNGCGTPISTADPNLGPLQDNGGPTETMALLAPSPAINAGDDAVCAAAATVNNLDQRGEPRPFGTHCDLGTYEFSAGSAFIVNTDADTDDGSCDAPGTGSGNQDCTLREAINGANADNTGAHEITFAGDYTITLTANLPNITGYLTISGVGRAVTVDGNDNWVIFNAGSWSIVTVDTMTMAHGVETLGSNGTLSVLNSTIRDGNADEGAGGIYLDSGLLTVANSTFYNNDGAITADTGTVIINNSTFVENNGATYSAISTSQAVVTITNSIITNSTGEDCVIFGGGSGSFNGSNNLIDDHASGPCAGISDAAVTNLDTSLADNGGNTPTIALLAGSNAIDTGDNATCETADQRGVSRPIGAACDRGAFELESGINLYLPITIKN